jgi:hypothetical protein
VRLPVSHPLAVKKPGKDIVLQMIWQRPKIPKRQKSTIKCNLTRLKTSGK